MEEMQLFEFPDRFQLTLKLESDGHWTLVVDRSILGRAWRESDRVTYAHLSLSEASDVMLAEVFTVRT